MSSTSRSDLTADHLALLRSIIDITRHPDRRAMEKGLIVALATHIPCDKVILVQRPFSDKEPLFGLVALDVEPFKREPEAGWHYDCSLGDYEEITRRVFESSNNETHTIDNNVVSWTPLAEGARVSAVIIFKSICHREFSIEVIDALLKIYQNYLNILRESESDKLTGLLNRRTFDGKFQHLVAQQNLQTPLDGSSTGTQQRHHNAMDHS